MSILDRCRPDEHTKFNACRQSVNWNPKEFSSCSGFGYIVQRVTIKGYTDKPIEYYEAWHVIEYIIQDRQPDCPDDEFAIGRFYCQDAELADSIGKKGTILFEAEVYWVEKGETLYNLVSQWECNVTEANGLKSAPTSTELDVLFSSVDHYHRDSFKHEWNLTSEDAIVPVVVDYCSSKWRSGEIEIVQGYLDRIEYLNSNSSLKQIIIDALIEKGF